MNDSRFHCEINSIKVEGMMVKFNIFGDTFAQVTADLEQVIGYVTGAAPVPVAGKVPPAPQPPASKVGTCFNCGSDSLEWVTGFRKDTQKPFAAFKCQECKKWQPEAKK
jgi:hypothetical protein